MTDRFNSYKNRGKQEEFVKRARAQAVQLRKAKKDEQLTKRRNLVQDELEDEDGYLADEPKVADAVPRNLNDILQDLMSSVPEKVLEATRASRKILSKESNPPIDLFIRAAAVPRFVALLSENSTPLQFEAAWVLTNIASGNESQTQTAVEAGVCEAFLDLARQGVPNVVEQVLWGLANIAGTGAKYRDFLLQKGILPILVELVCKSSSRTLLATAAWCLSNLCRKMGSVPDFGTLLPALPALSRLLRYDSPAIVSDACWALSYFTDGPNERIQAACEAGIVPFMIALIGSCNDKMILIPALRVIGNIVTGDDLQTQKVLDAGALAVLSYHLREGVATTKKEVIWALSNILAGNVKQVETVIEAGLLQPLIEVLSSGDYKCRVEATWAICNFTCGATSKQIGLLLEYDALGPLSVMLEGADSRLIKVVLDAFGNIFRAAQDLDVLHTVMQVLEEAGFVDRVELLQMHELEEIYKRASHLTSLFSPVDISDETDDMSLDIHQTAINFAQM